MVASSIFPQSPLPIVKATALAAIRLSRPDVGKARAFFENLGLACPGSAKDIATLSGCLELEPSVIIQRGPRAYLGLDVYVDTPAELEALSARMQTSIVDCEIRKRAMVELVDPDGIAIGVLVRPAEDVQCPIEERAATNRPGRSERINEGRRADAGQETVYRLGHTVLATRNLLRAVHWYRETLGMLVSDCQLLDNDPVPVVAFMRFDRGDTPTDHHSIALGSAIGHGHMHTAFEMLDMESVARAQHWLVGSGYRHAWGMGRHVLGSQIFDYWCDPWGDQFELYADGDVFDASVATGTHAFNAGAQHQWGPPMTAAMQGGSPIALAKDIVNGLITEHDLSPSRLLKLFRATRTR